MSKCVKVQFIVTENFLSHIVFGVSSKSFFSHEIFFPVFLRDNNNCVSKYRNASLHVNDTLKCALKNLVYPIKLCINTAFSCRVNKSETQMLVIL